MNRLPSGFVAVVVLIVVVDDDRCFLAFGLFFPLQAVFS